MTILTIMVAASFSAWAKQSAGKLDVTTEMPPPTDEYHYMSDAEYIQLKKTFKELGKARKIADVDALNEEQIFSPEFKNIRNELIGGPKYDLAKNGEKTADSFPGLSTADELAGFIDGLEKKYYMLPADAQYVAAPLIALKPYRGITVRLRPLFKDGPFANGQLRGAPVTHAALVTAIRLAGAGVNVFTPTPQWKAGFAFFTEPYKGMKADVRTEGELKTFVRDEALAALRNFRKMVAAIKSGPREKIDSGSEAAWQVKTPFYFDNKIMLSNANFVAEKDRFLLVGEAERRSLLSGIMLTQSALESVMGYSWSGLISSWDSLAGIYGFQQTFNVSGATAADRKRVLQKFNGKLFYMNDEKTGKAWMSSALKNLKEGVHEARLSWLAVNEYDHSGSVNMFFDPRVFSPFGRMINTGFENMEAMITGSGVKSAVVSGQVVDVNLTKFFTEPPRNLLDFLPIGFEPGDAELFKDGKKYRNYIVGSPKKWKVDVYQKYCPSVHTDEEVKGAARILSQAWGGWVIGLPLAGMVL
jgi:hypothetical protein